MSGMLYRPKYRNAAAVLLACLLFASGRAQASCQGDCNSDGEVRVNEVITLVNVALGNAVPNTCETDVLDCGFGGVQIVCLTKAINRLLIGCDAAEEE